MFRSHRLRAVLLGASIAAVGVLGVSGTAAASGPNLIVNGSFESPAVPYGTYQIFTSIPGWSFVSRMPAVSSGIEIQNNVAGSPAVEPPGALPAGQQFVELDSDAPYNLIQDIPTVPGETYRLEFLYSPRPFTDPGDDMFRAVAGSTSELFGPLTSGSTTMWKTFSFPFTATDTTTEIRFEDASDEATATLGLGAYIDRVSVRAQ
jgi:hypothetical protein